VLGSLSKTYSMTGWRAGYALGPKPIIAAMGKLQSQSTSSTASFVQKAAIAALNSSQDCVAEMRADFLKLRDRILARLAEIPGVTCTKPEGAFYVYPNVSAYLGKPGAQTAMELASRLLRMTRMEPFRERHAGRLSGGMKQKLALMCTLLHRPEILFLDEPTNGVDPVSRRDFWAILYELLQDGTTIFLTTAYLDEAERCNRVGLLHKGKLIHCAPPQELKREANSDTLEGAFVKMIHAVEEAAPR